MLRRPPASTLVIRVLAAVLLTGFGGLLFELLALRWAALDLGQGSQAQGWVLAAFLLGLGVGGRRASFPRSPRGGLLPRAGLLYLGVGVLLPLLPLLASLLRPGDPLLAPLFFLGVGIPAVFMGEAFPLCVAGLQERFPWAVFALNGSNLLGSCLGLGLGALALLPLLGFETSLWFAVGSYGLAFVLLLGLRDRGREEARVWEAEPGALPLERPTGGRSLLFLAGASVLLLEIWLPRRLAFSFGSFLPTQAGSLLGILLGLSLGSFLFGIRAWGSRLGARTLGLASFLGVLASMGLIEVLAGELARLPLESLSGALFRASLFPGLLLLPASVPMGALIPAWIAEREGPEGGDMALPGRAFYTFSMGAALVGLGSPLLFALPVEAWGLGSPLRFLPLLAAGLLILGLAPLRMAVPLFLATLLGVGALLPRTPLLLEARNFDAEGSGRQVLAEKTDRITTASVVLDRVRGERFLYTDEFSAAGGVESKYMEALGLLPVWLSDQGEGQGDFACLGLGTGRTAAALLEANRDGRTWIVEISKAVADQLPFFLDACGIREAFSLGGDLRTRILDGRFFLERAPRESLRGLTLEPLLPQAPGSVYLYSVGFYRAGRRALEPGGVLVQWVPTHALPRKGFLALLRSFRRGFERPRLLLVQESSLLLGRKGGLKGAIPERGELGERAAFLSGLFRPLDLALAELPFPDGGAGEVVEEERPFLERMGFEPAAQRLGWLARNLEALGQKQAPAGDGRDLRDLAQRERLAARVLLARRFEDPGLDAAGLAARMLEKLRERFPSSTLLLREERRARFLQERDRAWKALLSLHAEAALEAADRALRLGPCDPVLLGTRAAALLALRGEEGARSALEDLRRFYPHFARLRAIQRRSGLGLGPLLQALARLPRTRGEGEPDPSLPIPGFVKALNAGEPRAWIAFRRRPLDHLWTLVQDLRAGKSLRPESLERLASFLDPASLALLEPWMARASQNLLSLARVLPPDLAPSAWMRARLVEVPGGFEVYLRLLERRKSPWALHALLDLFSSSRLGRKELIRCSLAWQRLQLVPPPPSPSASQEARVRWVKARRKELLPIWNYGFPHQSRFLEWK